MYNTTLSAVGLVCCNEIKRSVNIFVECFLTFKIIILLYYTMYVIVNYSFFLISFT